MSRKKKTQAVGRPIVSRRAPASAKIPALHTGQAEDAARHGGLAGRVGRDELKDDERLRRALGRDDDRRGRADQRQRKLPVRSVAGD